MNNNKNNANINGKKFEDLTSSFNRLLLFNFKKKPLIKNSILPQHFYLYKEYKNKKIIFVFQSGFKKYLKLFYNIDIFRNPDEAFIIEYDSKIKIIIIEKKFQIIDGSTEIKLWAAPILKEEYNFIIKNNTIKNNTITKKIDIEYILSVNNWFYSKFNSNNQKYLILLEIFKKYNIQLLYGESKNYFKYLDIFIFKNF